MAYTITLSDGTFVTLIPDLTVNNTAMPINLFGRGFVDYGMALDENFVFMLEHFSDSTPPSNPLVGQLWYNNVADVLYLRSVTDTWVPVQTQVDPTYKEITVLDGNGNSAELDGTGNLYLQTQNPSIGFLTNFASPLSSGQVIASITLTSGGILQVTPGLSVMGNEVIQGSLDVSGSVTTGSLVVVNGTTTTTLNVSGSENITGSSQIGGNLGVTGTINVGQVINSAGNITAAVYNGTDSSILQNDGVLYLVKTDSGNYASINFDDGTGLQGRIQLVNVGSGVNNWNVGAPVWPSTTNPYVLVIQNGLEVIGNQLITGNLTVDGTVTSANSGNFVPIAGGTMTGDLIVNQPGSTSGITVNANAPTITIDGTSTGGTTNGTAALVLEVDGYKGALFHYIDTGGNHVLYLGVDGGSFWGVNLTANFIGQFCPFILDANQEIWVNGTSELGLGIFAHANGGAYVPALMLCDPGAAGGHGIGDDAWSMGMQLYGTSNSPSNNYQMQWGNFNAFTGTMTTVLMSMDYQGNTYAHSFTPTSDPKLKKNIAPLGKSVTQRLLRTPTYSYNMKNDPSSRLHHGVVADESFELLWPELVHKRETIIDGANTEIKAVNYNGLIAPLIELVKSQEERIKALEAKLDELLNK